MSTTTFKVLSVPATAPQRGARLGAQLFVAAWNGVAGLFASAPRAMTPAEEAAEVREMARHMQHSDPGFASDLMAAADRHEAARR
jgi:hypothetical protein